MCGVDAVASVIGAGKRCGEHIVDARPATEVAGYL
jgi:hypothetical protein